MLFVGILVYVLIFVVIPLNVCFGKRSLRNRSTPKQLNGDKPNTDRYCPYCRTKLTKPNDCDSCGREFLRADALTETQAKKWGMGPAVRIVMTRIVIILVIWGVFFFCVVVPLLWLPSTCLSCGVGALVAYRFAIGTEKKYGRLAAAPVRRLGKGLTCATVGFAILSLILFVFLSN